MRIVRTKSKISASAYLVDDNHRIQRTDHTGSNIVPLVAILVMLLSVYPLTRLIIIIMS